MTDAPSDSATPRRTDPPTDPPGTRSAPARDTASSPLAALVAQCVDRMEDEGDAVIEAVCRQNPEHAAALRERIERLRRFGLLGAPAANEATELPERLGGFRILAQLGRGGMGVVYLAEQEALGRRVALKLVRPEHLYFPGARERFRREIATIAKLQHPGIVPIYAAGEASGVPFYAMEFVRGAALEEVLAALAGRNPAQLTGADLRRAVDEAIARRDRDAAGAGAGTGGTTSASAPASPSRGSSSSHAAAQRIFGGTWAEACLRVVQQVAVALQHAHERSVLHRDVKPSNVMLTPDGRVLLLDFGLAAVEGDQRLTRTGSQLGSLAWMSPEQVRGGTALDARTDVYSLGSTLYELLTLRSPFIAGDVEETRRRILEGRVLPIRELNPAVPRDAETVCLKAMDREREQRYASAADFADDIANALELRPVLARRPSALLKARRWAQRHPAAAAAAALGALVLVGGPLGYGVVQSRAAAREQALNTQLAATNGQLDRTLVDLQSANTDVEAKRAALEQSLGEAQRQREHAQHSFDQSLAAVDEMLRKVGAEDLADLPGFEPVRRALLERALDFYRGLQSEQPGDARLGLEQARTHRVIANLLRELGRYDEARPLYAQLEAEARALIAAAPDSADAQALLAQCLADLGNLDSSLGRGADAEQLWTQALAELEELPPDAQAMPDTVHEIATMHQNLGFAAGARNDLPAAVAAYQRAADILAPACAAHPERADLAALRADAMAAQASNLVDLGRADEAEPVYRDAWATLKGLLAHDATDRELRTTATECASNYGLLLLSRGDHALAEGVLRDGFAIARGLARDFPQQPDYGRHCAVIGINLFAELINQDRPADAEPIANEAGRLLEQLAVDHPDTPDYPFELGTVEAGKSAIHVSLHQLDLAEQEAARGVKLLRHAHETLGSSAVVDPQLATALFQWADVQQARGDPAGALKTIEEGLALGVRRPDVLYQAAEELAQCTLAARDDKTLAPAARAALQQQLEDRALAVLKLAIGDGFRDFDHIRNAAAFDLLRARPEFETLVPPKVNE